MHLSIASGHLSKNLHPDPGESKLGGLPGMNFGFFSPRNVGIESNNPFVYGCFGSRYISVDQPNSTIFPPYIIPIFSTISDKIARSCEINIIDTPFFFKLFNKLMICA